MCENPKELMAVWIFGRGASIDCGITWEEESEWKKKNREERIRNIDNNLTKQVNAVLNNKHRNPYRQLISILKDNVKPHSKHLFITTNWDYLLQKEVDSSIVNEISPAWLSDSQVYHLNGSIEKYDNGCRRTPIILPDDVERRGIDSLEFQRAMNLFQWERFFVFVGVSFKYKVDQQVIDLLKPHEDNLPFGKGKYLIVNNRQEDLEWIESIIKNNFPRAEVIKINYSFKSWVEAKCP